MEGFRGFDLGQADPLSIARAEDSALARDHRRDGDFVLRCPWQQSTEVVWVALRVVTRLNPKVGVRGVSATVAGSDWGVSGAEGRFRLGEARRLQRIGFGAFTITARYENADGHLLAEEVAMTLEPGQDGWTGRVNHHIAGVQDFAGEAQDAAFDDHYRLPRDCGATLAMEPGDTRTDGEPILAIELHLATFSLDVPYLNQNHQDDTVCTTGGEHEALGLALSRDLEETPGRGTPHPWKGSVLCSPTSGTMLSNYWRRIAGEPPDLSRTTVLQRYYDTWGEKGFNEAGAKRIDRLLGMRATAAPPGEPFSGSYPYRAGDTAYWLQAPQGGAAGGKAVLHRFDPAEVESADEDLAERIGTFVQQAALSPGTHSHPEFGQIHVNYPTTRLAEGDFQVHVPLDPEDGAPVVDRVSEGETWEPVREGSWRVKPHGGAEIWKYPGMTAEVAASYGPEGARPSRRGRWPGGARPVLESEAAVLGPPAALARMARLARAGWVRAGLSLRLGQARKGVKMISGAPLTRPREGERTVATLTYTKARRNPRKAPKRTTLHVQVALSHIEEPLEGYKACLGRGWPFISSTTATGSGHVILWRGAVVTHTGSLEWLIANDPYGSLAEEGTVFVPDFQVHSSIGRYPVNLSEDVDLVEAALEAAGYLDEGQEATDAEIWQALAKFQRASRRRIGKYIRGRLSPGDRTARALGVELTESVGRPDPKRQGADDPETVRSVRECLAAQYGAEIAIDEPTVDDDLLALLARFTREQKTSRTPGYMGRRDRTAKRLRDIAKGGYAVRRDGGGGVNKRGKGDAAAKTKGRHVYYRNDTPGFADRLRLKHGSFAWVEHRLTPAEIGANLTPGF